MHAQNIIQDLLQTECDSIHAKRRLTLALMVQASCIGTLSLMGLSRRLNATTPLRHRIKSRVNSQFESQSHVVWGRSGGWRVRYYLVFHRK